MKLERLGLAAAFLLALASGAWAMGMFYSSGVSGASVTSTTGYVNFVNNASGGTSQAFTARVVTICNDLAAGRAAASTKYVYYHLSRQVAANASSTLDLPLGPLECHVRQFSNELGGTGWASIGFIAASGDSASLDITASK